ncbi:Pyrimidine operon regulatory protein / Uracil phosphoribosyltransferase [Desulfovibrionales bacterium]
MIENSSRDVLTGKAMARTIERLAYEVLERHGECQDLVILGIQRRGVDLGARLQKILEKCLKRDIPLGKLDINLYRDDWSRMEQQPVINESDIPCSIDEREVLLVDDVLFTGRTVRAALEAILDFGRPRRVELLVLVDRGHWELPIHADFVGKLVEAQRGQHVNVLLKERDGHDKVCLVG